MVYNRKANFKKKSKIIKENMNKMIKLSKSCLGKAEKKSVISVLDNEFLGMGEYVKDFEERLTDFFGRPAVCLVNGTAALHVALQSANIKSGDEVLVQSLTYIASFQAISATGGTPVACDIDPETLCINLADAKTKISNKTKAIMPVHYSGGVGDLSSVYEFAKKYNLRVIEDAAHAFGTTYMGKKVGGFGDISCFSFDGIKNITSGEGGCVVSSDKNIIDKIKNIRQLGIQMDSNLRYENKRPLSFDAEQQGWRYHMSNIMASIGLEQLKRFDEFSRKRRKLACMYDEFFQNSSKLKILKHNYSEVVPHIYVVQLGSGYERQSVRDHLNQKGIQTGIHYQPNHKLSIYKNETCIENVDNIYPQLLTLPLHPDLNSSDIEYICHILLTYLDGKHKIN